MAADYKSFGHDEDDDKVTALIVKDETTGWVAAHRCDCKGASDSWVVDQVKDDIDAMGHTAIVLKTDGEPAIVQVQQRIKELRVHETIHQHPPAYDPQSNGAVERAVQEFMNTMRAMKLSLEQRLQVQMGMEWKAIDWMIEHCADIINHCLVGHDGKTPYMRLMGKRSGRQWDEFGEQVFMKQMRHPTSHRNCL